MPPQTCIKMCFHSKTIQYDASVDTVLLKTQTDAHRESMHIETPGLELKPEHTNMDENVCLIERR